MGAVVEKRGETSYFFHGGANMGFRSQYFGSMEDGNGVVIMVNSDNDGIIPEIANSVASVYHWKDFYKPIAKTVITLAGNDLLKYIGEYRGSEGLTIKIRSEGNHLTIQENDLRVLTIYPQDVQSFFIKEGRIECSFSDEKENRFNKITISVDGRKREAVITQ